MKTRFLLPCALLVLSCVILHSGCSLRPESSTPPAPTPLSAQAIYDRTAANFHQPAAEARGAEQARLLTEAAAGYEHVLKRFPRETNVCLLATRGLANVRASQGRIDDAVRIHVSLTNLPAASDWDRLIALKSAADLLWDARREAEAKPLYHQLVESFDRPGVSQMTQTIVRGSRTRLDALTVRESRP